MKRRIRQVIFLLGILISCCLIGGCESEDNRKVSITLIHAWGGTEKDHIAMREIYNEFQKEYPDIGLSAEKREIGGLGIYMVKKSMDEMSYCYSDGKNILVIKKNL